MVFVKKNQNSEGCLYFLYQPLVQRSALEQGTVIFLKTESITCSRTQHSLPQKIVFVSIPVHPAPTFHLCFCVSAPPAPKMCIFGFTAPPAPEMHIFLGISAPMAPEILELFCFGACGADNAFMFERFGASGAENEYIIERSGASGAGNVYIVMFRRLRRRQCIYV